MDSSAYVTFSNEEGLKILVRVEQLPLPILDADFGSINFLPIMIRHFSFSPGPISDSLSSFKIHMTVDVTFDYESCRWCIYT